MVVTLGGRFGGYGLYVLKGKPVFTYNFLDLERFRWQAGLQVRETHPCSSTGRTRGAAELSIRSPSPVWRRSAP